MERLHLRLRMSFLSVFSSFMTVDIANLLLDTWEALGGMPGWGSVLLSIVCVVGGVTVVVREGVVSSSMLSTIGGVVHFPLINHLK